MAASEKTNKVILSGVMMALTAVATMLIAIPVPFTNGYIHLGDSMVFLSVIILGWRYGAIVAGAGASMADIFLGYVHWAPWTFLIKGAMALVMGLAMEKTMKSRKNTSLTLIITIALWAMFNMAVAQIVNYEGIHRPSNLLGAGDGNLSAVGDLVNSIQLKLMFMAIAIPVMLIIVSVVIRKKEHYKIPLTEILAMTLAGLFMVFGYYVAGGLIYGNFGIAAFSIPMNMIQFIMGFLVAALLRAALSRTPVRKYFVVH